MFIPALFTIAKQPKSPSTDEWIKKRWYVCVCVYKLHIYLMAYYSVMKKNEILPFAAMWMDLKNTVLSEIGQRKTNIINIIYMISHIYGIWNII